MTQPMQKELRMTPEIEYVEANLRTATKIFVACILVISVFAFGALWITKDQRGGHFLPQWEQLP